MGGDSSYDSGRTGGQSNTSGFGDSDRTSGQTGIGGGSSGNYGSNDRDNSGLGSTTGGSGGYGSSDRDNSGLGSTTGGSYGDSYTSGSGGYGDSSDRTSGNTYGDSSNQSSGLSGSGNDGSSYGVSISPCICVLLLPAVCWRRHFIFQGVGSTNDRTDTPFFLEHLLAQQRLLVRWGQHFLIPSRRQQQHWNRQRHYERKWLRGQDQPVKLRLRQLFQWSWYQRQHGQLFGTERIRIRVDQWRRVSQCEIRAVLSFVLTITASATKPLTRTRMVTTRSPRTPPWASSWRRLAA